MEDQLLKFAIHLPLQEANRSPCTDSHSAESSNHQEGNLPEGKDVLNDAEVANDTLQSFTLDVLDAPEDCSPSSPVSMVDSIPDEESSSAPMPPRLAVHLVEGEDGRFRTGDLHADGLFDGEGTGRVMSSIGIDGRRRAGRGLGIIAVGRQRRSHSTGDLRRPCGSSEDGGSPDPPSETTRPESDDGAAEVRLELLPMTPCRSSPKSPCDPVDQVDASDSLNADLEVCGIMGSSDTETSSKDIPDNMDNLEKNSPIPKLNPEVTTDGELDLNANVPEPPPPFSPLAERTENQPRLLRNNASSTRSLRIRIRKSPGPDTDSSNDYESETGIPRSPTLFISGVSISRTPEPRSPAAAAAAAAAAVASVPGLTGRQSRSSSLTVPTATLSPEPRPPRSPLSEPGAIRSRSSSLVVPGAGTCATAPHSASAGSTPPPAVAVVSSPTTSPSLPASPSARTGDVGVPGGNPNIETEREAFGFPRSSTDGALSSVLHVQEGNLGSDDFHEALFLERSPRGTSSGSSSSASSRRRRRSRRERDVEEERQNDDSGKEATSAL
ncbi:hypothetical protein J437_LFUL012649 [Ladona fulva]|uniref:Uncharacterized protein n=1 Tax=Ladona fulva TaxID=123851 RepID=A0A8K0KFP7_LADFU|nr:hypothetical protein J437_LFUL012649 [Ladona fulva]